VRAAFERPLYLTLDQGGHASRALVFDHEGAVVVRAVRAVQVQTPAPDRVEQDPEELVASFTAVIHEVIEALGSRAAQLVSAGLATQRSSIVCWDRTTGAALSPVLSWQDRRAHAWLDQFADRADDIHRYTGLRLSAHYGASKLRWCLDHLDAVARARREQRLACGPLASFLVFRLLQEHPLLVDPANAARTLLWNVNTLNWDPRLCGLFGVPSDTLPRCVPSRYDYGTLATQNLRVPLTLLNGDQSAALFAYGAPHRTTAYINMGTGAFVQRTMGHYPGDEPRLLTGVVYHDGTEVTYVLEGTVNGAGAALHWAEEKLGIAHPEKNLDHWLRTEANPPLFLNGVSGLGAPYWVADFESKFIEESTTASAPQKIVAICESILFLLQANLDELKHLTSPTEQIFVSGGLTASDALCQRLADLSGFPVYRPAEPEATARGTAYLLANQPEYWPENEIGIWFKPRPNDAVRARYARWRTLMPRLTAD
jgi:glycerol kinase